MADLSSAPPPFSFVKPSLLVDKVLFVDGVAHAGKLLMGPLLSAFHRVELHRLDTVIEHIAVLHYFGKVSPDAATVLMRNAADEYLYNCMISRSVNFRPTDASSVFQGLNQERYLQRLLNPEEGAAIVERIEQEKPIYQNLTHEILGFIEPCFEAFGERLFVVEMVRDPIDIVECWLRRGWGNDRFGLDPRSFVLSVTHGERTVPYFARDFAGSYHTMRAGDRVVYMLRAVWEQTMAAYQHLSDDHRRRVLFVKFEDLVTNTTAELERVGAFLDVKPTERLPAVMAQQRCPRQPKAETRPSLRAEIERHSSSAGMRVLDDMCRKYEELDVRRLSSVRS